MALELGGLLGAASSLTTAFGKEKSLKSFLSTLNSFGVQNKARFEVNFSGLEDVTFFVRTITTPGVKQNIGTVYYDGVVVEVPINYEYEHDFSMTVLNDSSGYIFSTVTSFLLNDGYTMTVKAIGDNYSKGGVITLNGVRFKTCSGLNFSYDDGGISTFDLGCSAIDFNATPGQLSKVGGVIEAIKSLAG